MERRSIKSLRRDEPPAPAVCVTSGHLLPDDIFNLLPYVPTAAAADPSSFPYIPGGRQCHGRLGTTAAVGPRARGGPSIAAPRGGLPALRPGTPPACSKGTQVPRCRFQTRQAAELRTGHRRSRLVHGRRRPGGASHRRRDGISWLSTRPPVHDDVSASPFPSFPAVISCRSLCELRTSRLCPSSGRVDGRRLASGEPARIFPTRLRPSGVLRAVSCTAASTPTSSPRNGRHATRRLRPRWLPSDPPLRRPKHGGQGSAAAIVLSAVQPSPAADPATVVHATATAAAARSTTATNGCNRRRVVAEACKDHPIRGGRLFRF